MKVLFDHRDPFLLAHGGLQIQIQQTKSALEKQGVEVDYLRWWDENQKCDIIHYFGRPPDWYVEFAHRKGIKVVMLQLLTGVGSRSAGVLRMEKTAIRLASQILPPIITHHFAWDVFKKVDACMANTEWEGYLMQYLFQAPREKIHVIPNGVEDVFFQSQKVERGSWLLCTATITERKRVLELAKAAVQARTPLWIVGKPYSEDDPYAREFLELATANPSWIRYEGTINDRRELSKAYRSARGFVLLSTKETLSLSAGEAAACECPLLLSNLPWARTVFGERASYCPIATPARTAPILRRFYDMAPLMSSPEPPLTWDSVGRRLIRMYEAALKPS